MDKNNIFFKIVIPNYNNEQYIEQCISSIFNQSFQDFEVIVVDDISTDKSYSILSKLQQKYTTKLKLIKASSKSYAGTCRNIGMTYGSNASYVWCIDGDDYLPANDILQKAYNILLRNSLPNMMFFQYLLLKNNNFYKTPTYDVLKTYYAGNLLLNCTCAPWSRIVKTTSMQPFENGLTFGEDAIQLLKIIDNTNDIVCIKEPLYVYRENENGITQRIVKNDPLAIQQLNIFKNSLEVLLTNVNKDLTKLNIVNKLSYMYRGFK